MRRMEGSDKFGYPKPTSALIVLLVSSFAAARAYYPADPRQQPSSICRWSRYLWHCLCPWHRVSPAYITCHSQYRQFGVHEEAPIRNGASGTRSGSNALDIPNAFTAIASGNANKDENLAAITNDDGAWSIAMSTAIKSPPVPVRRKLARGWKEFLSNRDRPNYADPEHFSKAKHPQGYGRICSDGV